MTNSDDLPITRREMRQLLNLARIETNGTYGQNVIEAMYILFNARFPKSDDSKGT